jgi:pimeloyl-ACP methyl ester carboxylesterase
MKFVFTLLIAAGAAMGAAPCTKPAGCTDWVTLGNGPWRSMVYTTYPLATPNPQITRAFVMIHGTNRDADNYFRTAVAAAFLAGALEDTVVIAPRIASAAGSCHDTLADHEVSWSCTGDSWRSGGTSAGAEKLTSFDFVDELLRRLAKKDAFPNLRSIVVAGHSAGGQFVNRYSMANQVHETLGVPVSYVVSNPSSYAYLDATRPSAEYLAPGHKEPVELTRPAANVTFTAFAGAEKCPAFDRWPYGLEQRTGGYTARQSDEQLKKQLASRPVTYLLGELDVLPLGGFDSSCGAMAQGPTRLARGEAFSKFVNQKTGAHHNKIVVPLCGHNARCMFTSEPALSLVFAKQE